MKVCDVDSGTPTTSFLVAAEQDGETLVELDLCPGCVAAIEGQGLLPGIASRTKGRRRKAPVAQDT